MSTDTGHFELTRTLPMTPDKLWHVLTDAKMRETWGAPEEGMVLTMEVSDFRVGGSETHRCGPADAPDFTVDTRWYRIDAPHDAAFTETVHIGGDTIATTLVTYRLSAEGTGSRLDVAVAVSSFTGPDADGEFKAGWEAGLANLEALVAKIAA
ncbi:SRPBCC domain-containing protein [uncultured Tateyamaria sp.]|uniref:SRPBCC domain-containing protein n=1 Tax=uncultured Tateyamaria sp. TaxID=455651 RepID=UPI00261B2A12|nr:SRPBCC domain-containing protein [uncultured Tateyamaria sp.]